ncbi:MAG: hypothetical protein ACLR1T_07095 [Evtepia gabavorous]
MPSPINTSNYRANYGQKENQAKKQDKNLKKERKKETPLGPDQRDRATGEFFCDETQRETRGGRLFCFENKTRRKTETLGSPGKVF